MSFAQTCHESYTIDYLSEGGYQSHSVTLACVDRDSRPSRLPLLETKNVEPPFDQVDRGSSEPWDAKTKCGGPCAKRGIRA